MELNAINPTRMVIGGSNVVYESLDQGGTITQINGPGDIRFAMAYGGRSGGVDNPDVLYVCARIDTGTVSRLRCCCEPPPEPL